VVNAVILPCHLNHPLSLLISRTTAIFVRRPKIPVVAKPLNPVLPSLLLELRDKPVLVMVRTEFGIDKFALLRLIGKIIVTGTAALFVNFGFIL
jgi:hypothetical protein